MSELAPRKPGSPTPDEADRGGGPSAEVIARGYEADGYDPKSVISVPILVIGFFVLAFTSVTIIFSYFRHPLPNPMANEQTVEDNSRNVDKRIAVIPRGRPEPLQQLDEKGGSPFAITRPPTKEGNPPLLHPEDIRPSPENTPTLFQTGWIIEGKVARIPLPEAMASALKDKKFAARANPVLPPDSSAIPTGFNAGRGKPPAPPAEAKKDGKGDDKKDKDEKKDGKKEGKQ